MIPFKYSAPFTLLVLASLTIADEAAARAGGGVSVGRASVSVPISRPAPMAAPRPAPSVPAMVPAYRPPVAPLPPAPPRVPMTTTAPAQSSGTSQFLKGMAGGVVGAALWDMLTPHPTTTVVAPTVSTPMAAPVVTAPVAQAIATPMPAPVVVSQSSVAGPLFFTAIVVGLFGAICYPALKAARGMAQARNAERELDQVPNPIPADPMGFFFKVQQAALDGDLQEMTRYCTSPALAEALLDKQEGVRASQVFKGVTWCHTYQDDVLSFSFRDGDKPATELWLFVDGRLDGIQVV